MDDDLDDLLADYLSGKIAHNHEMDNVEIVWIRDQPGYGALHIARHNVTEAEVEEVLFEIPPEVEAKRHHEHPDRTVFWGATRKGRWLFIVCEDWTEGDMRFLKPLTAFEPDEGEEYWRAQ